MIKNNDIDNGKPFDWGRTSADYAKYRDIYPPVFYEKIHSLGIGTQGQKVLDIGTGTGVIPRNMYKYGADFTGTDISENQIEQASRLAVLYMGRLPYEDKVAGASEELVLKYKG